MQRNRNRMMFGLASESVCHYKYILVVSFQPQLAGRSRMSHSKDNSFRAYIDWSSAIAHLNL
jgi:hypothetical protein